MEIEDFTLEKQIGKGAFGEVFITKKKDTNLKYATKKVKKSVITKEKMKKYFNNELFILKHIKHENIINLVEIKNSVYNFFLIFEYCNGGGLSNCLENYKKKYGKPFPENYCQHLIRQIVDGIQYLHASKILHRDLKSANVFLFKDGKANGYGEYIHDNGSKCYGIWKKDLSENQYVCTMKL